MSKLSLEALKERASEIANEELLAKINGNERKSSYSAIN